MVSRSSTSRTSATRPAHHANNSGTLFRNPWPSAEKPNWSELMTFSNPLSWYNSHNLLDNPRAREINVLTPDWGASSLKNRGLEYKREKCVIGTWLGHAGVMVELPIQGLEKGDEGGDESRGKSGLQETEQSKEIKKEGKKSLWMIFDPIFSQRAGPNQYVGPERFKPTPVHVEDLPGCDAVLISHNHYDHLDLGTIKAILERFPNCKFFVPLNNKAWMEGTGVSPDNIHELDWWNNVEFKPQDFGFSSQSSDLENKTTLKFTCVPAQHNSGRGTLDQGTTLWSGWVIEQLLHPTSPTTPKATGSLPSPTLRHGSIYFAGDTGLRRTSKSTELCPIFSEIGQKLGPFDISFLPIWRGGTLGFISYLGLRLSHRDVPSALHASPKDAVLIHNLVKSRHSMGIHFGTFVGSENEVFEATIEFDEAREKAGVMKLEEIGQNKDGKGKAGLVDIGESLAVEIEVEERRC